MSPRRKAPDPWPWPEDSTLDRARRVAGQYRESLSKVDPDECARIDAAVIRLGQGWVVPQPVTADMDDLLTVDQAAEYAGVRLRTIDEWRRRGLVVVTTPDGVRVTPRALAEYQRSRRERRASRVA
ncbi:helix-turn-helix domain-containing protein [Goodfellowiella coeruleoviolacea]|uniref:Helix-turn-helix domain-containing protein n=1 Tax=Goodfellowiella coeruleoviolacea TaxID=334858 RepID=A0AAE3GIJ5_9PSEU|nr:helix-turn-helix domain-containing protein [Goodfellowiella coeruleoviolacea]MCP2168120.1 Helix-turn-helix domain-containing protein [Goodfellowiella coeruleoviolacea]